MPEWVAGLTDGARRSVPQCAAEAGVVGEVAESCHPTGSQNPWAGSCPRPDGNGPGRRSGGEAPQAEAQGGARLGQSGEEWGLEG